MALSILACAQQSSRLANYPEFRAEPAKPELAAYGAKTHVQLTFAALSSYTLAPKHGDELMG